MTTYEFAEGCGHAIARLPSVGAAQRLPARSSIGFGTSTPAIVR